MEAACFYLRFGLIVTGRTEEEHLPKLFRSLAATGLCHFEVIRRIGQRGPVTSVRRRLRIVGSGQVIPTKDVTEIGFPARRYLSAGCRLVVLVDDLERRRRGQAAEIFQRYREAIDAVLNVEQRRRAAVHFLVNMLEAYYFADAEAVNAALGLKPPLRDYEGDVEAIRNPKSELRQLYPAFDEVADGERILSLLDVEHILARPETCAWLRTLFAWCVQALARLSSFDVAPLGERYHLHDGVLSPVTGVQLE